MKKKDKNTNIVLVPNELIEQKIFLIRGKKVMLDKDLANLYKVGTRDLNKAVKRNADRFPEDFMFQLSDSEFKGLMFHFGTSKRGGTRKLPNAFTEQGVAMLSGVLNSKTAIQVHIQIIRTFARIRELIISNKELRIKMELLEKKYDNKFKVVFEVISKILAKPKEEIPKTKKIGFDIKKDR